MKIEEAFRDLKGYLRMEGVRRETLENAEKTMRLLAFAYALGLVVDETMRQKWREKGRLVGGNGGTTQVSFSSWRCQVGFPFRGGRLLWPKGPNTEQPCGRP